MELFKDLPEIRQEHLPTPWKVRLGPTGQAWIIAANDQPVVNAAPELARRIVAAVNEAEACAVSDADCESAMAYWNAMADTEALPGVTVMNADRRKKLKKRIKEAGGLGMFKAAIVRLGKSRFLCGQNDRRWKASFDFILQPESLARLLDGKYDDDTGGTSFMDYLQNGGTRGYENDGSEGTRILPGRADTAETPRALPSPTRRQD